MELEVDFRPFRPIRWACIFSEIHPGHQKSRGAGNSGVRLYSEIVILFIHFILNKNW